MDRQDALHMDATEFRVDFHLCDIDAAIGQIFAAIVVRIRLDCTVI